MSNGNGEHGHDDLPQGLIKWDKWKLKDFEAAYNKALKEGKQTFEWRRYRFVTTYARYLIELLHSKGR